MNRKTQSSLPPIQNRVVLKETYDIYPAFETEGEIFSDIDILAEQIASQPLIVIDGYEGVFWPKFIEALTSALQKKGRSVRTTDVGSALKDEAEIEKLVAPYLGDADSIFGRMTDLRFIDFFDRTRLKELAPDKTADINILYGCGAALARWHGSLLYVDLPKNELQFRMAAHAANNIGSTKTPDSREFYKRCYFVDWPVLDSHKERLIPKIDWIIDEQRIDSYTFTDGNNFRDALGKMCRTCFRVRPWFAPGVWGGTYLRDHIEGLNPDEPNLAWSYELMALENGIMFQHAGTLMEVSFSFLMSYGYREILGRCADDFGKEFPIRFDFLDTIGGGNLSIQCHPRPEYIRSRFGKPFTQDETYYILQATPEAQVYLGLQEGVNRNSLSTALSESQASGEQLDVKRFVQSFPAQKHALFLIPNGTIHASGSGNLVLEISSAPYIFTFKMYDWMRLDIDGRPRPINIEHGLNNLRFERQGKTVSDTLISHPTVISRDEHYTLEHLPTHPDHFYDVHRHRLQADTRVNIETDNSCQVWMVVEGPGIEVTCNGQTQYFHYLETFIIPAAAGSYSIRNRSQEEVIAVQAFIKDQYEL